MFYCLESLLDTIIAKSNKIINEVVSRVDKLTNIDSLIIGVSLLKVELSTELDNICSDGKMDPSEKEIFKIRYYDYKYCNKPDRLGLNTQERYMTIIKSSQYSIVFKDFYYFNREEEENDNKKSNYALRKFKNPHNVYLEEITGNTNSNDSTIINRNILSNKSTDDELHTDRIGPTLYKRYSSISKSVNSSLNSSRKNSKMNIDVSMNSSYSSRKHYPS